MGKLRVYLDTSVISHLLQEDVPEKMADTRATPSTPLPDSLRRLPRLMPPMATTGTSTASQMARKVSFVI